MKAFSAGVLAFEEMNASYPLYWGSLGEIDPSQPWEQVEQDIRDAMSVLAYTEALEAFFGDDVRIEICQLQSSAYAWRRCPRLVEQGYKSALLSHFRRLWEKERRVPLA